MSITPTSSFAWNSDDSVVVKSQAAVAVYCNQTGGVVIRQQGDPDDDADYFVVIRPENAATVARAIMREAGCGDGEKMLALPAPSSKGNSRTAAAARQKRYRARKRDGDSVTQRDGVTGESVTGDGRSVTAETGGTLL